MFQSIRRSVMSCEHVLDALRHDVGFTVWDVTRDIFDERNVLVNEDTVVVVAAQTITQRLLSGAVILVCVDNQWMLDQSREPLTRCQHDDLVARCVVVSIVDDPCTGFSFDYFSWVQSNCGEVDVTGLLINTPHVVVVVLATWIFWRVRVTHHSFKQRFLFQLDVTTTDTGQDTFYMRLNSLRRVLREVSAEVLNISCCVGLIQREERNVEVEQLSFLGARVVTFTATLTSLDGVSRFGYTLNFGLGGITELIFEKIHTRNQKILT